MAKEKEQISVASAYECLKYIRIAPGKVYEYELYQFLDQDGMNGKIENVARTINHLFGLDFAVCDVVESSYVGEGLNVIYTNPEYRLILDLLLSREADYALDRTVYMDALEEKVEGSVAVITVHYNEVKRTLDAMLVKHPGQPYVAQAVEIFKSWPTELRMEVVNGDDILSFQTEEVLDLSGKYVVNLDLERLQEKAGKQIVLKNFKAEQAFFSGKRISFDNACFEGGVTFKGSIIKGETLSFRNARFTLDDSEYTGHNKNEITFRNTRMLIRNLLFDEIVVDGNIEDKLISMEDAVIEASYISFSKMNLNDTALFCYQTLMGNADVYMIEPRIAQSRLDFEDSVVKDVIMLNISAIPELSFGFRSCEKLIIENCNITDNVFLNNMKIMSLRACRNQGKILTDWGGRKKDGKGKKNFPILLSVMNNSDADDVKAEQFILLKENFQNIGQYEYEDEAFIQYMNYKYKHSPIRFAYRLLNFIGKYGISPGRVLLTMFWTVVFFGCLNVGFSYWVPSAYSFTGSNLGFFDHVGNSFYLSVSNLISYDCNIAAGNTVTIISSIVESVIGWFLLGYLSVAVVRKTLR